MSVEILQDAMYGLELAAIFFAGISGALAAVRKAGRFPVAPAELTGARYSFGLAIRFAR